MNSNDDKIARLEERIVSFDAQISTLEKQASALEEKESRYRRRRRNKEQKVKTLRAKRDAAADRILLHLIRVDPAQQQRLHERLSVHLKSLSASSLFTRRPMGVGQPPAVGPEVAAASPHHDAPPPSAGTNDTLQSPAETAPSDAPHGPHDSASAASLPTAIDLPNDKPRPSADPIDAGGAPSQPKAPRAGTNVSAGPGDEKITEIQLPYLRKLVVEQPDKARRIGIDEASLPTLSKAKASWAIRQLAPPRRSAPRSRRRS